jgi:DNA-binding beta-propeller fold protein YncE
MPQQYLCIALALILTTLGCEQRDCCPIPNTICYDSFLNTNDVGSTPCYDKGIFVLNEGNFGSQNGTLSYLENGKPTIKDLFRQVNGFDLGDVVQYMNLYDGRAYIVVNNSQKIEIVNSCNMKSIGRIGCLPSPRYILPISNTKAYISNFVLDGTTTLQVVNLETLEVTKEIATQWAEQMIQTENRVLVGIMNSPNVLVIDTQTDTVVDTLKVPNSPQSFVTDQHSNIWLLCSGKLDYSEKGALLQINPNTLATEQSIPFTGSTDYPTNLTRNADGDTLYFLNKGKPYLVNTQTTPPTIAPLPVPTTAQFYGMGFDTRNNTLYLSDALDYSRRGIVYAYQPTSGLHLIDTVGIIPGAFCFPK